MNYFQLFEIEESFFINKAKLKQQYFALSKKFHPDFFGDADTEEKENALQQTALVNKAYKALSQPFTTMQYILEWNGLIEAEEKYNLSPDFLMEMMELNEALVDAKMEDDNVGIEKIKQQINQLDEELYQNIKPVLESYSKASKTQEVLLPVKEYYYQKKYLNRILDSIK